MEPRCEHSANNHGSFMTGKQRESGELEKKNPPFSICRGWVLGIKELPNTQPQKMENPFFGPIIY